jgi:hypothetical protein
VVCAITWSALGKQQSRACCFTLFAGLGSTRDVRWLCVSCCASCCVSSPWCVRRLVPFPFLVRTFQVQTGVVKQGSATHMPRLRHTAAHRGSSLILEVLMRSVLCICPSLSLSCVCSSLSAAFFPSLSLNCVCPSVSAAYAPLSLSRRCLCSILSFSCLCSSLFSYLCSSLFLSCLCTFVSAAYAPLSLYFSTASAPFYLSAASAPLALVFAVVFLSLFSCVCSSLSAAYAPLSQPPLLLSFLCSSLCFS